MVLASGVFITTTPFLVAADISILSIPTPALPITDKLLALLIIFESNVVPLLITKLRANELMSIPITI